MSNRGTLQWYGRLGISAFSVAAAIWSLTLSSSVAQAADASTERSTNQAQYVASPEKGWPQFRGPRRDGISNEKGLLQAWPANGPAMLWKTEGMGRGFSSPIVADGKIFVTGDAGEDLVIRCLDLQGKELWQAKNGMSWKDPYPGARGTPAYSEGKVYHQNAHGRLVCLDAKSGKELWNAELLKTYKGKNITWGLSEGPVVDARAVYVTAGGEEALVVALDKNTGNVLWKSKPLRDSAGEKQIENPSYVSPILVKFGGKQLLIGCSLRNLYCVDTANGEIEWVERFPTSYSVLAMPPLLVENGVFMTAPHGKGGRLMQMVVTGDNKIGVELQWTTPLDTAQGGTVYVDGKIFGSFYPGRKGWGAIDAKTGKVTYTADAYVKGAVMYADKRIYALSEDGMMRLLEPTETEFKLRGEFQLAKSESDAWAHPVLANGKLYLRYHDQLFCYDVKAK